MAQVHGEDELIQRYMAPLVELDGAFRLRDDCAELVPGPSQAFIVKTDPIRAGVHFLDDDSPADLAWKALAVNVSDLAAKAARPVAYLAALSFPEAPTDKWLAAFAQGLAEAQNAFGLSLIGGDTDRAPGPISIAITVFGEMPIGAMIRRVAVQPGDLLFVSGCLGDAALGLAVRTDAGAANRLGLTADETQLVLARYLRPRPRLGARAALRAYARAAMDLSDGLAKDAGRMMTASGCGCDIELERVPLSRGGRNAAVRDPDFRLRAATHGDDYELLVAVPPDHAQAFQDLAAAGGVEMTKIGRCRPSDGVQMLDAQGQMVEIQQAGYDHF